MDTVAVDVKQVQIRPHMRLETVKLIEALKQGKVGDTKTDEELKAICGKDTFVGGAGYAYLQSAIRHVLNNEPHLVWQRVTGAGCIKCLGAPEVASTADSVRRSTCRREKRVVRQMRAVYKDAEDGEQKELGMRMAVHGTLAAMASSQMAKKLEARDVSEAADPAKLLEAMVGAKVD